MPPLLMLLRAGLAALLLAGAGIAGAAPLVLRQALAINSAAAQFPEGAQAQPVSLPDDWSRSRPRYSGEVWYRVAFDAPPEALRGELMAVYIDRVCSNLEVDLNGDRIFSGGRMQEPVTRNCHYPQLVTVPPALLKPQGNQLDLHVRGMALQHVAARQRAGGLSELKLGLQSELAAEHASQLLWNITTVQIVSATLLVVGTFMLVLYGMNRGETYLMYFGALLVAWSV
ncbi:MAG TPA: sensor histidine kinase, partial [Albitalea sp.]|nr:sensor histidine kinase [Albitalea sp.]